MLHSMLNKSNQTLISRLAKSVAVSVLAVFTLSGASVPARYSQATLLVSTHDVAANSKFFAPPFAVGHAFVGGDHSLVTRAIGYSEGNRTLDAKFRPSYYGHRDPGNGAHNLGSFSGPTIALFG